MANGDPPWYYAPQYPFYYPAYGQPRLGWVCPQCQRSNNPDIQHCPCSPSVTITTTMGAGTSLGDLGVKFDCHYDGDIEKCDKDCKQLGQCKRRS